MSNAGLATKLVVLIGEPLAAITSYALHKNIGWAIVHGFFGWTYILYLGVNGFLNSNPDLVATLKN